MKDGEWEMEVAAFYYFKIFLNLAYFFHKLRAFYSNITPKNNYCFGSPMTGRTFSAPGTGKYMYGFNGQEQDNEVAGDGNINTAQYWEYESRLGRRWNIDPKPIVGISEYSSFVNNPILYADEFGDIIRIEGSRRFTRIVTIAIGIISQTNLGNQVLTTLKESHNIYTIRFGTKNAFIPETDPLCQKVLPSGLHGAPDPIFNHSITWGGHFRDIFSLGKLFHELSHARDQEEHELAKLESQKWTPPDVPDGVYTWTANTSNGPKLMQEKVDLLQMSEVKAMDQENIFRAELGEKPNEFYASKKFEYHETNSITQAPFLKDADDAKYLQVAKNGRGTHPQYNTDYSKVEKSKVDFKRKSNYERGKKFVN